MSNFNVEVYVENEQMFVYIGSEDGSGWKKPIDGKWQIGEAVQEYCDKYLGEIE